MTNLTKEEHARLHLKAKRGMLTAEERAALEAYEDAAQPAPMKSSAKPSSMQSSDACCVAGMTRQRTPSCT